MKRSILGLVASSALAATLLVGTGGALAAGPQNNPTPGQCPYGNTPAMSMSGANAGQSVPGAGLQLRIGRTVNAVAGAFQQRDGGKLRATLGSQLRLRVNAATAQRLANCLPAGSSVKVLDRAVSVDGATARVTVHLAITTPDGKMTQVERVWTLAKQSDGTWKVSTLPSCPLLP